MKNKNIGFLLIDYHSGLGGLEKVLLQVIRNLEKRNLVCTVFFLQAPTDTHFLNQLSQYKVMGVAHTPYRFLPKFINRIFWNKNFKKKSHDFFTEVISTENLDALITLDFSNGLLKIQSVLEQYKLQQANTANILWPHMSCDTLSSTFIEKTQDTIKIFDTVFAISNGLKMEFEQYYRIHNIDLLYNPIAFPQIIPKRNPKKLIFLGRVNDPRKRVKELLEVLTKVSGDWSLDLIGGTGSEEGDEEFKDFIASLGLQEKVSLSGWVAKPWSTVTDAGILLLNSTNEGFPLVLLEAMARGVPCISSDCKTGPNEIIYENINGWLYDVDDMQKLQNILQEIVNGDRLLPAQEKVIESVQKFSKDIVIENFKNQVLKVIHDKKLSLSK